MSNHQRKQYTRLADLIGGSRSTSNVKFLRILLREQQNREFRTGTQGRVNIRNRIEAMPFNRYVAPRRNSYVIRKKLMHKRTSTYRFLVCLTLSAGREPVLIAETVAFSGRAHEPLLITTRGKDGTADPRGP